MQHATFRDSQDAILVLGLSEAEHLQDEAKGIITLLYAGPRFKNDNLHCQTTNNPRLSEVIDYFASINRSIAGVIIYADIFSLSQFRPSLDVDYIPKVCVVGDTHHGPKPITNLASWLIHSGISTVALKQTIHHGVLFESLGFNVIRLPLYAHNVRLIAPTQSYFNRSVFIGSLGHFHKKRTNFIQELLRLNVHIDISRVPRDQSFLVHNIYGSSFNFPLNSDINYRIWEIMASGSVCITQRFPMEARAHLLAKEDENVLCYDSIDEFIHKMDIINNSESLRMKIANKAFNAIKNAKLSSLTLKLLLKGLDSCHLSSTVYSDDFLNKYNSNLNSVCAYELQQTKNLGFAFS